MRQGMLLSNTQASHMERKLFQGVLLRITPALLFFVWWQLSNILLKPLDCTGSIKIISRCSYNDLDVTSLVSNGLFFGYILWLPLLLLGILGAGKHVQKELLSQGHKIPTFNYKDAYTISLKSLLIWTFISGAGTCSVLVALYPEQPESLIEWVALVGVWVPLWSAFNWFSEKAKH